jgi:hypothetical protein
MKDNRIIMLLLGSAAGLGAFCIIAILLKVLLK